MNIKILFEKQADIADLWSGWGISYLIDEKMIFDLGEKKEFLDDNLKNLKIDIKKINKVVISHNHWDHWGGLNYLLELNKKFNFFVTPDFYQEFNNKLVGQKVAVIDEPREISRNIYTLGSFKAMYKDKQIHEQALCLRTDKGLTIICGCSHPGVLEYIKRARELFKDEDVYLVMGGFHLMDKDRRIVNYIGGQMKDQKVQNIGPGHCTGFEAVKILRNYYPNNLMDLNVGNDIEV